MVVAIIKNEEIKRKRPSQNIEKFGLKYRCEYLENLVKLEPEKM